MKVRKKLILVLITGVLCAAVAACSTKTDNNPNGTQNNSQGNVSQTPSYRNDVSCADLEAAAAKALGDEYFANTDVPAEYLEPYGLTAGLYDDFVFKTPMISVNVDTIIVVKASEGHKEDVLNVLTAYQTGLKEDSMQYPSNLKKIQNSIIVEYGDYAAFIQVGGDTANAASMEAVEKNPNISDDELDRIESEKILEQNNIAANAIEDTLTAK